MAMQFNDDYYRLISSDNGAPTGLQAEGLVYNSQDNLEIVEPEFQWDEIHEGATVVLHQLNESSKLEVCFFSFYVIDNQIVFTCQKGIL